MGLVQSMVEVAPESALLHGFAQIHVGGRDNPHVHRYFTCASQTVVRSAVQHAQQLDLHLQVQLAHFVQKQRAGVGYFEEPLFHGIRPAECASLVPEQFAFQQVIRQGGAVYVHPRTRAAERMMVHRARHHFFAAAGFARDQDSRVALGDPLDHAHQLPHGVASNDRVQT